MMSSLLPIGTVVILKGATKKLMITGYYSKTDDNGKLYTYNACIFPEGFMENTFCLFNPDQIEKVFYKGLENDEYKDYVEDIVPKVDVLSVNGLKNDVVSKDAKSTKRRGRVPKAPTKPLSISEMRAKYTTQKISGNQTEMIDFSKID